MAWHDTDGLFSLGESTYSLYEEKAFTKLIVFDSLIPARSGPRTTRRAVRDQSAGRRAYSEIAEAPR